MLSRIIKASAGNLKISAVLLDVFLFIIYNQHVVFQKLITLGLPYKIGKV